MRCMACGGEMRLIGIVPDEAMAVAGFERHTLKCGRCRDTEQRLVFNRPAAKFMPEHAAPPLSAEEEAAAKEGEERLRQAMETLQGPDKAAARDAWRRTVDGLRGKGEPE